MSESKQPLAREARDRALFDAIAGKYARKDLFPSSRTARRQRLLQTLKGLPVESLGDVLEVGCGAGYGSEYLKGCFFSFTGIDYSEQLIDFANDKFRDGWFHGSGLLGFRIKGQGLPAIMNSMKIPQTFD